MHEKNARAGTASGWVGGATDPDTELPERGGGRCHEQAAPKYAKSESTRLQSNHE